MCGTFSFFVEESLAKDSVTWGMDAGVRDETVYNKVEHQTLNMMVLHVVSLLVACHAMQVLIPGNG